MHAATAAALPHCWADHRGRPQWALRIRHPWPVSASGALALAPGAPRDGRHQEGAKHRGSGYEGPCVHARGGEKGLERALRTDARTCE